MSIVLLIEIFIVLAFVFSLGQATAAAMEDGDISWSDALKFVEPLKKIGPAIDDIEDVLVEVQDINSLTEAMLTLVKNKEMRFKLGNSATREYTIFHQK